MPDARIELEIYSFSSLGHLAYLSGDSEEYFRYFEVLSFGRPRIFSVSATNVVFVFDIHCTMSYSAALLTHSS